MEWKYKTCTEGHEHIKLYNGDRSIGALIVKRDQSGRIVPERTHAFVETYNIELDEFYRSIVSVEGISDQDRRDLTDIVRNLKEICPADKSEDSSMWLWHRNMVI